jgi:hypothetical protein
MPSILLYICTYLSNVLLIAICHLNTSSQSATSSTHSHPMSNSLLLPVQQPGSCRQKVPPVKHQH